MRMTAITAPLWALTTGPPLMPWRDVPPAYGPWQTVYGLFRCWQRDGTWRAILTALQGRADAAGADHLGRQRGIHGGAGAPARGRGAQARGPAGRPARRGNR